MLDKTDRLTDRQTDRQMKGQSEIAYLPKFADLYVKLKLEFLIASPISYIWAFDRFSSSNFDRAIAVKFLLIFGPFDVINKAIQDRL